MSNSRELPPIESIHDLELDETLVPPQPLIEGLLECGSKLMLVATSKGHKSWTLMMLAMCISNESVNRWFRMPVHHCRVLYINFEIQRWFFRERLRALASAMNLNIENNTNLDTWNLRGHSQDEHELVKAFKKRLEGRHNYGLAIVDPFYKLSGGGKAENVAEDVASVMRAMDTVTVDLGVGVAFAHHPAKGDMSERSVVDRGAGSGVFGRDPDAIISVMELKNQPECFLAEFALRNHPPKEPLGLKWQFPFFRPADDVQKTTAGRKPVHDRQKLLALLDPNGETLTSAAWEKLAWERLNLPGASYRRHRKTLVQDGEVQVVGENLYRRTFMAA